MTSDYLTVTFQALFLKCELDFVKITIKYLNDLQH